LLFSVRDAARRGGYSSFTALNARAADLASQFADQVDTPVDQPMHKHLRKADCVLHCDASDNALVTIIVSAPTQEDVRTPFCRRLLPHEAAWSSMLRELTGYHDAYLTLRRLRAMRGMVIEIVGDSLCCF
jgi:hypothetical protein